jgi:hypothetical protein
MPSSKYQKYVLKEPKVISQPKKPASIPIIGLSEELMSGFKKLDCNFSFVAVTAPYVLSDPPHKHDCDELLFFISTDLKNTADLGGEVEIALGEEWEKHTITTSAIICLPKGIQHCPVYVKKVDRPFYFGHLLLASKYGSDATPDVEVSVTIEH